MAFIIRHTYDIYFLAAVVLSSNDISQSSLVISVAIIFLTNILAFYLHDALSSAYSDKLKSIIFEQEKEFYFNQCEIMTSSIEDVKSFRHDTKNYFVAIAELLKNGEQDKALEYVLSLTETISSDRAYSTTGNVAFDSIINYKLRYAKDKGINVTTDIVIPTDLYLDIADVVTVMGNLLDNAINAVLKVSKKEIFLKIRFSKGIVKINLDNTFNGLVKNINGVIATTSGNKELHGYGLNNVRKAMEKYNGEINISHNGSMFSVYTMLYVNGM